MDAAGQVGADRAVRLDVQCVNRTATRHVQAVVLRAAEREVRATLRQTDMGDGLALRGEHPHTPSKSSDLPLSWYTLRPPTSVGSDSSAPLLPQPHQRLPSRSTLKPSSAPWSVASISLVLFDNATPSVGSALPLDHVELLLVGREREAVRVDEVGDHRRELAVTANSVDVGGGLFRLGPGALPLAVDAEQRVAEPDAVVGFNDDVVGCVELLAFEAFGQDRDLAVP